MIRKIIIVFFCPAILILSGCNFLDKEPGDVITEDHYWKTADATALEQYCNSLYPRLITGFGTAKTYNPGEMINLDIQSDNILSSGVNQVAYGRLELSNTDGNWNWSNIRTCNSFLQNYRKTPLSENDRKKYAGEILFFKVMDYFNKVKRFGDVPWYNKAMNTNDPDLYKGRDSRVLVTDSMLKCIDMAINFLPQKEKVYRISKDAALALKARFCLYEGTWRRYRGLEGDEKFLKEAYEAAGELMKPIYGYSLYQGTDVTSAYHDLFIQDDYNANPEIILSREYDFAVDLGHNVSNQIPFSSMGMSRDCFDEYLCSKTGLPITQCSCHKDETNYLKEMKNRDNRLSQSICIPEKGDFAYYLYQNGKGGAPNIFSFLTSTENRPFNGSTSTGYAISKFYKASEYGKGNNRGCTDAPVFRYAEILLIRAEAAAELGKDPELDKTINLLRKRVGFTFNLTENPVEDPNLVEKYPDIRGTNANLIREIRRERRVELFGEGYRWDDICRWHAGNVLNKVRRGARILNTTLYTENEKLTIKEKVGVDNDGFITPYAKTVTYTPDFKERNYLFPVPPAQISLNPNLRPQNPGWE